MFDLPLCHAHFLPHLTILISAFPLFYHSSYVLLVGLLTLWFPARIFFVNETHAECPYRI